MDLTDIADGVIRTVRNYVRNAFDALSARMDKVEKEVEKASDEWTEELSGVRNILDKRIVAVEKSFEEELVARRELFLKAAEDAGKSIVVEKGDPGDDGKSAYEVAVANGFAGSEKQWLESLVVVGPKGDAGEKGDPGKDGVGEKGERGDDGKSAYEVAVGRGFSGDEREWLASLLGRDGDRGEKGENGKSAFDVAVEQGFVGDEKSWITSLIGHKGDKGDSIEGPAGPSAYAVAVQKGFAGTETEWLDSLRGKDGESVTGKSGEPGKSAYEIAKESGFAGTEKEWLSSLSGQPGVNGKSAFELAVEKGFHGSESDWLSSLKGAKGDSIVGPPGVGTKGDQGEPGRDALQLEIMSMIDTEKAYARGTYASHGGGLVRATRTTDPLGENAATLCGWEVVVNGISAVEFTQKSHRDYASVIKLTSGDEVVKEFSIPAMLYREVYRHGVDYVEGDCVTYGGSLWYCQCATRDQAPGTNPSAWRLAVKAGRDGKDGSRGERGPAGKDLTRQ